MCVCVCVRERERERKSCAVFHLGIFLIYSVDWYAAIDFTAGKERIVKNLIKLTVTICIAQSQWSIKATTAVECYINNKFD